MKMVVLDGYTLNPGDNPWSGIAAQGELIVYDRTPADQILERAKDADILLTNKTPLRRETLEKLPQLKFISVLATGYNVVDIAAAKELGIPVSNVPTYGTSSVAQHTLALLLELCLHVGLHAESVRAGEWSREPDFCYWKTPLLDLNGRTIGLIGFGRIGQRVAEVTRALGMRVLYLNRQNAKGTMPGATPVDLETLCREADVISLHCALTQENQHLINREFLSKLKSGALIINTARGGLINEADLAEALHSGKLGGAALDVLSVEPPPPDHPLLSAPRCLITPHIAWASLDARRNLMRTTEDNIAAFLQGKPVNRVNG